MRARGGGCVRNVVLAKENRKRTEFLDRCTHLVQLLRTNVWAVGEAKVDETPFAQQVLLGERLSLVVGEREWPANLWSPDRLIFPFFV